jgi:type IV pilus assembly protein PilW
MRRLRARAGAARCRHWRRAAARSVARQSGPGDAASCLRPCLRRAVRRPCQGGATLPEMMIALALGMLLSLLATALLVTANAAYLAQYEAAGVDDGGRFALEIVTRAVRQAAFVNWEGGQAGTADGPANVAGLDDRTLVRTSDGIDDPRTGAVNGSDVLALRFGGSGPASGGDGSVTSCAGFGVGEADDGWSIFYVARNADGEAELRCKYRGATGWGADAIVSGVDSFQVLYGLDTDEPPDGVANQYLNASMLNQLDAALVLTASDAPARARELQRRSHWKRVTSIRVALLTHGTKAVPGNWQPQWYDLFGSAYGDAFGGLDPGTRLRLDQLPATLRPRPRKLFSQTILLRNRPS